MDKSTQTIIISDGPPEAWRLSRAPSFDLASYNNDDGHYDSQQRNQPLHNTVSIAERYRIDPSVRYDADNLPSESPGPAAVVRLQMYRAHHVLKIL